MRSLQWHVFSLVMVAYAATGCGDRQSPDAKLEWGWITNCAGPEFSKFGGSSLGPDRPVFKLTDQLVLAVPKAFAPSSSRIDREPKECRRISDLHAVGHVEFTIQGDWSSGHTLADVPNISGNLKPFRPDRVWVRIEPERPSQLSAEEQKQIDEAREEALKRESVGTREIGGLTCFVSKFAGVKPFCSGHRSPTDLDMTTVTLKFDASTPFVLIQADYPSLQYGRVHVYWQAWTADASNWREIETAIWGHVADWNLLNTLQTHTRPR